MWSIDAPPERGSLAMHDPDTPIRAYDDRIADWRRRAPWLRRLAARLGLQGKLIVCFMLVLSAGLGATCWLFISHTEERLTDLMGEEARQVSYVLALASRQAMESSRIDELRFIGQGLLKSRNIRFVAFIDRNARPLLVASHDAGFKLNPAELERNTTLSLMQVQSRRDPTLGDYIEVTAPVLSMPTELGDSTTTGSRVLGYVAVGLAQAGEQAQLQRINVFVIGIGIVIAGASFPLAYLLVRRIFLPIRQLVEATDRIAGGDLDAQVAIDRPDTIGTLARSFNDMVQRVRGQQQALAEANHDLEDKVRQRTAQLERSNHRLSAEIAEKEDFLRAVSHDLNAPLRNIAGMASMLLTKCRGSVDADVIHRLERIQKNVEVETDLIGELLELSRIKTRRKSMELVDVTAMVRELGDIFEQDLQSRQIALVIDNPLPVVRFERARMRQVFQNLIDNAIKYMGDDPGRVREIHVGGGAGPDGAVFYVRDTGIGIDPEDQGKVFFIFRRGRNIASARNVEGKGVGLASVKSIIESYGGSITVESAPGAGSTFRLTLGAEYLPESSGAAKPPRPVEVAV